MGRNLAQEERAEDATTTIHICPKSSQHTEKVLPGMYMKPDVYIITNLYYKK